MYPGEGMYVMDEPVHHHHHLPKMDDDDDDNDDHDNDDDEHDHHHHHDNHHHDHSPNPGHKHHKHPHPSNTPPPRHHHHQPKRSPTPPLRPQQPLQPPTPLHPPQPLQASTPLHPPQPLRPPTPLPPQPPLQPPVVVLQPPQQVSAPSPPPPPTPHKPQPPPPMDLNHPHHYNDGDDDDDDDKYKTNPRHQQLGAALFVVLLVFGIIALILWLIYRPSKPHFTAVAALVYSLNITSPATAAATTTTPPFISASMQFVIHTRNPNKRTTLTYDKLAATVYYRNTAITPPVPLPPLFHRKKTSVIIAPVIGGPPVAVPVPVGPDVVNGLAADEAYGVVGFSWVMVGRVRYRAGGFKSGHSRVYVRCDVWVRLNGINGGLYTNPGGQVPLLGAPPCLVDI